MNCKDEKMKCPHLTRWIGFFCNADQGAYVPSLFQLEEYCKTIAYKKCPFLLGNPSEIPEADVSQLVREEYINDAYVRNESR